MALARERCEACTPGTPPLGPAEVAELRGELDPAWEVEEARIRRSFSFGDFAAAFAFAARVALIAEGQGHHPDMTVGWGRVGVELSTHSIGGLSRNDFIVAARIDRAAR